MPDTIVTKPCSRCKQALPTSAYFRDCSNKKDALRSQCKICSKQYRQSPQGKRVSRRYARSQKRKAVACKHNQTTKGRATQHRHYIRYHARYPEKYKSRQAVKNAIAKGILPRAKYCLCTCGKPAQEYHHHLGYAREYWLAVVPICIICHRHIHE